MFAPEREICAILPMGCTKSTLAALTAVHHVVSHPDPSVFVGAGSREQARVIGRMVERFARHPAFAERLVVRHDEIRLASSGTVLQIVASDGGRAHGWERPSLMVGDEDWTWSDREPTLLGAMQTALVKNPDAKLLLISTASAVVGVTADVEVVEIHVFQGDEAVLRVTETVLEIACGGRSRNSSMTRGASSPRLCGWSESTGSAWCSFRSRTPA